METKSPARTILKLLAVAGGLALLYFGNVALQTHWGEQAQAATGLPGRSLEQALPIARAESKPIFLMLSAIWCPTCRAIDKNVLTDPAVKKALEANYVFARMDYESAEAPAFQKSHNLSGFPNILILSPDGKLKRQLPIPSDSKTFLAELDAR